MNRINHRLRVLQVLFIALMIALGSYFVYSVAKYGKQWSHSAYNTRTKSGYDLVIQGSVYDRNGTKIAWSDAPNTRLYSDDEVLRLSMAHILGDRYGMMSGALQDRYANTLFGNERSLLSRFTESVENDLLTGDSIRLTIDGEIQKHAYNAMNGRSGAAVVLNYKTGEVIASVSLPTFDTLNLTAEDTQNMPDGTFINKVTRGLYPPGSTFKVITAVSLLENCDNCDALHFDCLGENIVDGVSVNCFHGTVHGDLDMNGAFARSCNGAFAYWAVHDLGVRNITKTAEAFGFNRNFVFSDYTINNSTFDAYGGNADLAWSAVGQGQTMVTPMHAAMIVSAIANNGDMCEPRYLRGIESVDKGFIETAPRVYANVMSQETAERITEMMLGVVENGTGSGCQISGVRICGKTGTAEVADEAPHAWFVGFIDEEETPYAIAVILENAGTGSSVAVPVARSILEKCIEVRP